MILLGVELAGGLIYLLVGGDLLVRGALAFARRLSIPPVVVGLTIVAIGTSAPELFISFTAALSGHASLAIGNVVGSNIANVLLVLGVPALIYPIACAQPSARRHAAMMLGLTFVFIALCLFGTLSLWHGAVLLALLSSGLWVSVARDPRGTATEAEEELERVLGLPGSRAMIALFIGLGLVTLPLGADLAIDGASGIALELGVSEGTIGLTLVAFGTSLPELSTTLLAAYHRSAAVAIGNVIGSNIMNLALIMGLTAVVVPIPVPGPMLAVDAWVMLLTSVLLGAFVWGGMILGRGWGLLYLLGYVAYIASVFVRG